MMPADLNNIRTNSIQNRVSKTNIQNFAAPPISNSSFNYFINSLPKILTGNDFRAVVDAIVNAYRAKKPVIFGLGAHVIKCGLSPIIVNLISRGIITAIAMNGATAIHDCEIALNGQTSEDVYEGLKDGSFGMAKETAEFFNSSINRSSGMGIGSSLGSDLCYAPNAWFSVLRASRLQNIPATVHVSIGSDIVHMHPSANGALIGQESHIDFKILCSVVSTMSDGGVYVNIGSAVVLPEVFLKAFTVAQNLGANLQKFTTVNMDMAAQYRSTENVINRPARACNGVGYELLGRHEIMLPVLSYAILDRLECNY